ncbi:MAG: PEP-CTERM sorting domain-containing protein [Phycisphaerae bacterium]
MFSLSKRFIAGAAVIALVAGFAAASPITGVYASPDAGTDFLNGRWTEYYIGGAEGQVGNQLYAASYDGTNYGTEWSLGGASLQTVNLLHDTGLTRTYETIYGGGVMELFAPGPWWDSADTGNYDSYLITLDQVILQTVKLIVDGQEETYTSIVSLKGSFVDFDGYEVSYLQAAAIPKGELSEILGELPEEMVPQIPCSDGTWGEIQKIRMEIVPEPATMSLLVLGGLGMLMRRRHAA